MDGIELIRQERIRQIETEGFDAEHDQAYLLGELAAAARCYSRFAILQINAKRMKARGNARVYDQVMTEIGKQEERPPMSWPWDPSWWKPSDDPVRNLQKAGALTAAEIDRCMADA